MSPRANVTMRIESNKALQLNDGYTIYDGIWYDTLMVEIGLLCSYAIGFCSFANLFNICMHCIYIISALWYCRLWSTKYNEVSFQ